MHVKKGDKVKIITGPKAERELGPARILQVLPKAGKVVVEGRNLVRKHIKGNPMMGTESRIEEVEAPIQASNVLIFSEKLGRGVRTQVRYLGDSGELFPTRQEAAASFDSAPERIKKVRYCVKSEEVFD